MVKFSIDIFESRLFHLEDAQKCLYYLTREQRDIMSCWRKKKWKQTNLWRKKCLFLSNFDKISRSNFKIFIFWPKKWKKMIEIRIIRSKISSQKMTKKTLFKKISRWKRGGGDVSPHGQIGRIPSGDKNPLFWHLKKRANLVKKTKIF